MKECLVGEVTPGMKASDHDYCGPSTYSQVSSASAFTLFVNNGGLRIPSKSVYTTIEHCEHIFKLYVCQKGNGINNMKNLKSKMILEVCHNFLLDGNKSVFADHELGANEDMVEDDHQVKKYRDELTSKTEKLIKEIFPAKVIHLNEFLKEKFNITDLKKLDTGINVPVVHPLVLANDIQPSTKKRKIEDEEPLHKTAVQNGPLKAIPLNEPLVDLIESLKPEIQDLMENCNSVKTWIQLLIPRIEDGNNFGVSIQVISYL
ncbi:Proteasome activator complex subunit 3 [Paramuricea clavata]|uniref:Proteasome activator complex subunit 3, partial n=1 Tax=Paramuricea clavata TaxID=317549 RepID=A0A6S7G6H2_PARCT|nr:Proteasome activator complex subunit 3 [Paramuricea clavata]